MNFFTVEQRDAQRPSMSFIVPSAPPDAHFNLRGNGACRISRGLGRSRLPVPGDGRNVLEVAWPGLQPGKPQRLRRFN